MLIFFSSTPQLFNFSTLQLFNSSTLQPFNIFISTTFHLLPSFHCPVDLSCQKATIACFGLKGFFTFVTDSRLKKMPQQTFMT